MRIETTLPLTGFASPTDAELRALLKVVQAARPSIKIEEREFGRAFTAVGYMFRTAQPSKKRFFTSFVEDASELLRERWRLPPVSVPAFLAACLSHADVVWQAADPSVGALLEVGLDAHSGLPCSNAWKGVLEGRPLLAPTPPATIRHSADNSAHVSIFQEQDGRMVPYIHQEGWR